MEAHTQMDSMQQTPEIKKVPIESIDIAFTDTALGLGYGSINAPETTKDEAEIRAQNMREFFVEVDASAPSDCIDGRHAIELLSGMLLEAPRPGVAGGAGVTGYGAAELTGYFGESKLSVKERFEAVAERLEDSSGASKIIKVGGHVDKDAVESDFAEGKTGCGAADKLIANIALLSTVNVTFVDRNGVERKETDEERNHRIQAVKDLTKAVFEQAGYYDSSNLDNSINELINTATVITEQARLEGWSGAIMKDTIAEKDQNNLVVLDTSAGGVHGHTERKVLFNYIDETTFDQDSYFDHTLAEEGEGREVFDVDVWHIRDIANKLANSPDEQQASKLFAAGVAFQIGTYLGLCDGSHRAFFAKTTQQT